MIPKKESGSEIHGRSRESKGYTDFEQDRADICNEELARKIEALREAIKELELEKFRKQSMFWHVNFIESEASRDELNLNMLSYAFDEIEKYAKLARDDTEVVQTVSALKWMFGL
jgi:hypothetical protein